MIFVLAVTTVFIIYNLKVTNTFTNDKTMNDTS